LQCVAVCCSVLQLQCVSWEPCHEALVTGVVPGSYLSRWLIWDMTYSYMRHDSFICGMWIIWMNQKLMRMCFMTCLYLACDLSICVTWRIYLFYCNFYMTHSLSRWLIHVCLKTHSYVGCDSSIWVTWRIHPGVDSLSCVWWSLPEDPHIYMYIYICIYICIHIYIYCVTSICRFFAFAQDAHV